MLEKLEHLPEGVDGMKATGTVSKEDYERVFEPFVDEARREGRRIRFLYELGPDFERFAPGGAWEDAKLGLSSMRLFDGLAVVSDVDWVSESSRLLGLVIPCPTGVFSTGERDEAVAWLDSLPRGEGASHRLIPELGVIVVEVRGPLRAQDFDALALTADTWLETHGQLRGLVIHAPRFPGWESFEGLMKHLRFVRDHHREIERVAIAADSELLELGPRLAEHFVSAELETFGYDELEDAIGWASGEAAAAAPEAAATPKKGEPPEPRL